MTDYDKLADEMVGGSPLPSPTEQKYDSLISADVQDRSTRLRMALKNAAAANPDALAKRKKLALETGLPAGVIEADEPAVAAEAYARRYEKLLDTNKPLADWLSNGDNATAARDEIDLLDGAVKAAVGTSDVGRAYLGEAVAQVGRTLSGAGEMYDVAVNLTRRGVEAVAPQPVVDFLTAPVVPWWLSPSQIVKRPGEQIKEGAEAIKPPEDRQNLATDISGALGQVTTQITAAILTGGTASTTMLLAQGADMQAERAQAAGASEEAEDAAVLAGASITALTERYGLDKLLNRVPPAIRNKLLRQLADVALAGGQEAAQEVAEGVLQNLATALLYDPNAPLVEGLERDALAAGGAGSIARLALNVILPGRQAHHAQNDAKRAEAITGALAESEVLKRAPAEVAGLVQAAADKGGMGTMYLPVEAWQSYFQSAGLDPAGEYERITGERSEYFEAVGTGAALPIRAGDYFTKLDAAAQQKFNKEFRSAPEAMSQAEAEAFEERREEIIAGIGDIVGGDVVADTSTRVYQDIVGQLLGSGVERGAAEKQAALYQAFFRTQAARAGTDPWALYEAYGLKVGRELPAALRPRRADVNLDPLIDRLRAGDIPTEAQARGPSLVDFLRERGVQDPGGDLATMDPDKGLKPFQRRLVREDGLTLDDARAAAVEAGYLRDDGGDGVSTSDLNQLLEAVDEELRGNRRYSDRNLDQQAEDLRVALGDLDEVLGRAGLDVRALSNEDIKRFLRDGQVPEGQAVPEETLDQPGFGMERYPASVLRFLTEDYRRRAKEATDEAERARWEAEAEAADAELARRGADPEGTLYQGSEGTVTGEVEPTFYSALARAVEAVKQPKAPAAQWMGLIKNLPGVKAEELEWVGLEEWLGQQSGTLTREEVLEFIQANQIQVQDVVKDNSSAAGVGLGEDEDPPPNPTRTAFDQYQLPGGENYRELLLTLPERKPAPTPVEDTSGWRVEVVRDNEFTGQREVRVLNAQGEMVGARSGFRGTDAEAIASFAGGRQQHEADEKSRALNFRSSHFEEKNILAHVRFNERTDADGKRVLFIEEIQSDWHQQGRKQGYAGDKNDTTGWRAERDPEGYKNDWRVYDAAGELIAHRRAETAEQAIAEATQSLNSNPVPDAPFRTTWPMLAFKRMVRYAAENGFERIAWTTGEQQADRYDLSKQVDAVYYLRNEDGTYTIGANEKGSSRDRELGRNVRPADLAEFVGKDLADKITESQDRAGRFSGVDLKVGGEGMKGFYDSILPKEVGKYVKRWGGKVGQTTINAAPRNDEESGNYPGEVDEYVEEPTGVHSLDITPAMREAALAGQALFQNRGDGDKRGSYGPLQDGGRLISLLERADLSTFLHESGHFFLDVFADLAAKPGSPEGIRQDFAAALEWMGFKDGPEAWAGLSVNQKREYHEKWARGFEAYLFEGKAPTAELRTAFARFRAWLVAVYRQLRNLNVEITDDVRRIMDRLVATEQEIAAASEQMNYDALPPEALAMAPEERAAYERGVAEARARAEEELTTDALNEISREQRSWWKARRAEVKKQVTIEVNARQVYQAQHFLRTGKLLSGEPLPAGVEPAKLARKPLVDAYGEEYVKTRLRGLYVKSGGLHPDAVGSMFGFDSGELLVEALVNAPKREDVIEANTDDRMRELYGDIMQDGTMPERAMAAVHNEKRGHLLLNELLHLRKRLGLPHRETLAQMKAAAEAVIARKKVRDISPNKYRVAEAKAARAAYDAAVAGDMETAATEKRKQLINHELYRAAAAARQESEKIADYLHGMSKSAARARIGKAGKAYLEQIDAILERYGFRKGRVAEDKPTALASFLESLDKAGEEVGIDTRVLNEARRQDYREVPMEELRGVRDAVKQLEHVSRRQRKFRAGQVEAEWEDVKSMLTGAILQNTEAGKPLPIDPEAMSWLEKKQQSFGEYAASLLKMETVVEWLDGGRHDGPWHRFFFDLVTDAQNRENDLTLEYTKKIAEVLEGLPKDQRRRMNELVAVPEIGESFTRRGLIAMALNTGNEGNYGKLLRGRKWTEEQVQAALSKLTREEWQVVERIWRTIDGLWPEIAALQERMSGLAPEKVEARKVQTPYGVIEGGYYPLVYDRRDSEVGEKQAADAAESMIAGGPYTRATTPRGHTKARVENFSAPILLSLDVLPTHLSKVIKDLTFRETVMQLNKVVNDPDIKKGLQTSLGLPVADIFKPWIQRVANDRAYGTAQGLAWWENAIRGLRMNTTVVAMGFKATTFLSQFSGFADAMERVKPKYLGRGLLAYGRNPKKAREFVHSLSGEMRHRTNNFERDVRDLLKRGLGQSTLQSQAHRFMLYGISFADAQVTIPTWIGAYEQARDGGDSHEDAIRFADKVVRTTQGSGAPKDLSAVQGNNELARAFTMFYSWLAAKYNRMRTLGRDTASAVRERRVKDFPALAARAWFALVLPALLGDLLAGRGPEDDEEPAEWMARKVLLFPLMTLPLVRDIAGAAEKGFSYELSPLAGFGKAAARFSTSMWNLIGESDQEALSEAVGDAVEFAGYVVGLPTAQAKITGGYLWDVITGEDSPEDPVDFTAGLLFKREE